LILSVEVGHKPPDFQLPDQDRKQRTLTDFLAQSLNSSLSAFDEDCDVVDDYSGDEFKFLVVSSC
jgi:hypothetical protein